MLNMKYDNPLQISLKLGTCVVRRYLKLTRPFGMHFCWPPALEVNVSSMSKTSLITSCQMLKSYNCSTSSASFTLPQMADATYLFTLFSQVLFTHMAVLTRELVQILNRFGAIFSADTHSRYVHFVVKYIKKHLLLTCCYLKVLLSSSFYDVTVCVCYQFRVQLI